MKKLTIEQQELLQQIIQGNNLKPITPLKALNEIKRQIGNIHIYSLDETPPRETTIELRNSGLFEIIEKELKEHEQHKAIEQAETRGFYFKDYQSNNEIRFSGNTFIRVGNQFVETKPCYEVKETTLYSCYNPLEYPSPSKKVKDAHFWSWKTHLHFRIDDYGKTWALTREELEK